MASAVSNLGQRTFFIKDLNSHLVCSLCEGYFREAHTVPDCLHTFCKCCLFKEFAKKALRDAKSCPTCKFNLGLRPYDKVVYDRNLQAIVDKIFPHFAEEEKVLEEQFYIAYENEESINIAQKKSQLLPQPAFKRPLVPDFKAPSNPSKKPTPASSSGSSSAGTGTATVAGSVTSASSSSTRAIAGKETADVVPAGEEFQGLTLRVLPSDEDTSPDALVSTQSSILPSLTRPLLRVSSESVSVAKVQKYIHKRLSINATDEFPPEAIEILRNGVVQPGTSSICRIPFDGDGSTDTKPHQSASDGAIVLTYRRSFV